MTDRWRSRAEPEPGQGQLYWHILFRDQPQVAALSSIGQDKLAGFHGLHFTPQEWLHITTLAPDVADEFTPSDIENMVTHARQSLSDFPSFQITLGKVFYHPEAIVFGIEPNYTLDSLRRKIWQATTTATGRNEELEYRPWIPHVTLAYSTADQSASPIISALGRELPTCECTINSIYLVDQEGPERLWNWRILAEIEFETS
jgi:2'-5' RNA ligase